MDPQINESSPSAQAHLSILQSVIQRMAANSTSCKAWCITLVSAILVIVADKGKPEYALIALLPVLLFMALDTYYLWLEIGFRDSYERFVKKLHLGESSPSDLYRVVPEGDKFVHFTKAITSFSVAPFYIALIALVLIAQHVVLKAT
ncbi:MAG: hypothetical protein ABW078_05525 [Sedimenticola sp.]